MLHAVKHRVPRSADVVGVLLAVKERVQYRPCVFILRDVEALDVRRAHQQDVYSLPRRIVPEVIEAVVIGHAPSEALCALAVKGGGLPFIFRCAVRVRVVYRDIIVKHSESVERQQRDHAPGYRFQYPYSEFLHAFFLLSFTRRPGCSLSWRPCASSAYSGHK